MWDSCSRRSRTTLYYCESMSMTIEWCKLCRSVSYTMTAICSALFPILRGRGGHDTISKKSYCVKNTKAINGVISVCWGGGGGPSPPPPDNCPWACSCSNQFVACLLCSISISLFSKGNQRVTKGPCQSVLVGLWKLSRESESAGEGVIRAVPSEGNHVNKFWMGGVDWIYEKQMEGT